MEIIKRNWQKIAVVVLTVLCVVLLGTTITSCNGSKNSGGDTLVNNQLAQSNEELTKNNKELREQLELQQESASRLEADKKEAIEQLEEKQSELEKIKASACVSSPASAEFSYLLGF